MLKCIKNPEFQASPLEADNHHKIGLKFAVKESASGEKIAVHQAFVSLINAKSGAEIVFVAEQACLKFGTTLQTMRSFLLHLSTKT